MSSQHINELYDKEGNLIGALLTAEAWTAVKDNVYEALGVAPSKPTVDDRPEPVSDWEMLKEYWDYPYPVDTDVSCDNCGNATEDWAADEPRKFKLSSANLAGLVSFRCTKCQAKVTKKHFKDEIRTECSPFIDEKTSTKEGRYNT